MKYTDRTLYRLYLHVHGFSLFLFLAVHLHGFSLFLFLAVHVLDHEAAADPSHCDRL